MSPWYQSMGIVGIVATITFSNTLFNKFTWDDRGSILTNKDVHSDATPISNLLIHDFWGMDLLSPTSHKSYRPVTVLTFRWNYILGGLNPLGYHFVNIILHAIASMLVVYIGERLLKCFHGYDKASLVAGLVFAVHPVHCDSVASVVGRSDILCTILSLFAIVLYLNTIQHQNQLQKLSFAGAIICIFLATLSKETGATTFGILFAIEIGRPCAANFSRLTYLVLFAIAFIQMRISWNGVHTLYVWTKYENEFALMPFGLSKVLTITHLHGWYLWKLLWAQYLCYDYGFKTIDAIQGIGDIRNVLTLMAYASVVALIFISIRGFRTSPLFIISAMALCPFIPAANVFFPVGTILAERLLYFPSVGFSLIVGVVIDVATTQRAKTTTRIIYALAIIIIYIGAMRARARNIEWVDEESLFASSLRVAPMSVKILSNAAKSILRTNPQRASLYLERAVALMPEYSLAHLNLAAAYGSYSKPWGKPLHSMHHLIQSCSIDRSSMAFSSLGMRMVEFTLRHEKIVLPHAKENILEKAKEYVYDAIEVTPLLPSAYFTLGRIAFALNNTNEALQWFERTNSVNNEIVSRGFDLNDQTDHCSLCMMWGLAHEAESSASEAFEFYISFSIH
ncbi:transmembrane and TPR repeat-containing protein 4 isoform X1 [Thraustotheca clavata]|uniref:dolichyl-phosphate-mannose--protein mannosyltransferase n=1 Tax=Thraustotheca clavata TaxID=74557 RepID=A0A1W0A9X3_9STRA|nr:transmembrane and TPR repeat-containing protein 4 isoform X1 [Thraustotheca clavata]